MPAYQLSELKYRMPRQKIYPEVLIQTWYRDTGPQPFTYGSGFFVGPWSASLLTAAHVVYRDATQPPYRVRVRVKKADGKYTNLYAAAVAVFKPRQYDVAILRLRWRRPGLWRRMPVGVGLYPNDKPFHSVLAYFDRNNGPTRERDSAAYAAPWMVYGGRITTHEGMSGGALMLNGKAVGVHHGERLYSKISRGVATPLNNGYIGRMVNDVKAAVEGASL